MRVAFVHVQNAGRSRMAAFARREVRERVSALLDEVLAEADEPDDGDGDETDGTDESAETEAAAGTDA
jgi:hypothetical protein